LVTMKTTTMTQYLNDGSRDTNLAATAIRETEKAVGFSVAGQNRIAWFPKSQLTFIRDDFYTQAQDQFAIPLWLLNRKAAEGRCLPWDIGSR